MEEKTKELRRVGESNPSIQYAVGDEVYVDFGDAGKLGPGPVVAKVIFDDEHDYWEGYVVRLNLTEHDTIDFGYFGADMITPADESNGLKYL